MEFGFLVRNRQTTNYQIDQRPPQGHSPERLGLFEVSPVADTENRDDQTEGRPDAESYQMGIQNRHEHSLETP